MLPFSQFYLHENNGSICREQALINLGMIRSKNYKLLEDRFNHQLLHSVPNGSEVTHLNAKESKIKYQYLIDDWVDETYLELKKTIIDKLILDKPKILNWSHENIKNTINIGFNNFVTAKKIVNQDLDLVFIDMRRDLSNLKIVLHIVKNYILTGKVIGICSNQEYKMLDNIECTYELIGDQGPLTLVWINK
jgi:hypothetical protein